MFPQLSISFMFCMFLSSAGTVIEDKLPDRFESEIKAIEKRIASGESPAGSVLFVGSSSIRMWKLKESFPDLKCCNHGFGGSCVSDSVYFFDRIAAPINPSVIVLYAGDNDIAAGKSPATVAEDFQTFVKLVESRTPDCRAVFYIAIKPSTKRWSLADKIQDANQRILNICDSNPLLHYVDVWTPMLNENGQPRPELLMDDGLHMNAKGYAIWAEALRPWLNASSEVPGKRN